MKRQGSALITGGAKRIGRSLVISLASRGYNIALHYHSSRDSALKTAAAIKKQGGRCVLFSCNLADARQTEKLIRKVKKTLPDLNLLVNNASVFEKSSLKKGSLKSFDRHFAINFKAPLILTKEFANKCKRGHIVHLLDTSIAKNRISHFAYLLSKKALFELTKLSAVELGPAIRVNGIAPGLILPPQGVGRSILSKRAKQIPLKRKGDPAHITQALMFLLENDFLTGQVIFTDGGESLI